MTKIKNKYIEKSATLLITFFALSLFCYQMNQSEAFALSAKPMAEQNTFEALAAPEEVAPVNNAPVKAALEVNDPYFDHQWALRNDGQSVVGSPSGIANIDIQANKAWDISTGQGVSVAVLDTGINEIGDFTNKISFGYNATFQAPSNSQLGDENNHGSYTSYVIAGNANNNLGGAGLAFNSNIVNMKISYDGNSTNPIMANAINNIPENVKIVNISYGGDSFSQELKDAITNSPDKLFVISAGNENRNLSSFPAYPCSLNNTNIICVGAHTNRNAVANFSNYSSTLVDIFAPGKHIFTQAADGKFYIVEGTSLSAPYVAAAAALIKEKSPELTPVQIKNKIIYSARKSSGYASKSVSGGRLDVLAALNAPAPNGDGNSSSGYDQPVLTLIEAKNSTYRVARFHLVPSNGESTFECKIDKEKVWSGCQSNLSVDGRKLTNGFHMLIARAINGDGVASAVKKLRFEIWAPRPKINRILIKKIRTSHDKVLVSITPRAKKTKTLWCGFSNNMADLPKCKNNRKKFYWVDKNEKHVFRVQAMNKQGFYSFASFKVKVR